MLQGGVHIDKKRPKRIYIYIIYDYYDIFNFFYAYIKRKLKKR